MVSISAETIELYPGLRRSGLYHRQSLNGDEKDLVDAFVQRNLTPAPNGQFRLVFVEPRLETGFPDIVVVYVEKSVARDWSVDRAEFTKREICLLHHLAVSKGGYEDELSSIFPRLSCTLERLETAGLIRCVRNQWRVNPTREVLAIRRVVAIEAKIGAWRSGLDQAVTNRWFASESYLLLPSVPKSPELAVQLKTAGVGLLTRKTRLSRPNVRAAKSRLPRSYATWYFNEWACHACRITFSPRRAEGSHPGRR